MGRNYPLKMKNGENVSTMEELREKFDLEKMIEHFVSGGLCKWMEKNSGKEAYDKVKSLTGEETDFKERFGEALGVIIRESPEDVDRIIFKKKLEGQLRKKNYSKEEAEKISELAVDSQERLEYLVDQGYREIYLLSGDFCIHKKMHDIQFVSIGKPKVTLKTSTIHEFNKQNLIFKGEIQPADENTKKLMKLEDWESCLLQLLDVLELELQKI